MHVSNVRMTNQNALGIQRQLTISLIIITNTEYLLLAITEQTKLRPRSHYVG